MEKSHLSTPTLNSWFALRDTLDEKCLYTLQECTHVVFLRSPFVLSSLILVIFSFASVRKTKTKQSTSHLFISIQYCRLGGAVAQRVERSTCDQQVVGLNPTQGKS